ncbi:MAG: MBL fold metallo-hydrolase [Candidatus Brocadiia bacterium]
MAGETTRLSDHLFVYRGPVQVGIVRDGDRALLIDFGDGSVLEACRELGIESIEAVVFTHHHRDQACGLGELEARVGVPAAERRWFEDVGAYWSDPKSRWHIYDVRPHHLMLAEPVRVDAAYEGGDEFQWGPATVRVLDTPGHTDGSVSYAVDVDGRRTVFCGDAVYGPGQVWDVHSLQKGTQTTDYHGFLGARRELAASLVRIKAAEPDLLVPSHGQAMAAPSEAIDALLARLETCYDRYVAISALRHYFPELFREFAGRPGHMAIRPGKPVPPCLLHFATSWVLVSGDGAAFVMDCGNAAVVRELRKELAAGRIRTVEGLWVTHYHDDHVDAIPAFQEAFDCPCVAVRSVASVIAEPLAWRLPCISPSRARVDRVAEDGESWQWHEFQMTAYEFPGQTLYHGGLLAEADGRKLLFVGDSFTMAGIDDYCTGNRNWLGRGVGFDRCLALVEELRPTHIFNCHVDVAFDFTPEQLRHMRRNLAEREKLFGQLVPWAHANTGLDEPWVRCHPYEQQAAPGAQATFHVVVTNHANEPRPVRCRAALPRAWGGGHTPWAEAEAEPRSEVAVPLAVRVPPDARPGRTVVPADVVYGPWTLPQFTEAIVVVA